jgi:hypothetical protein
MLYSEISTKKQWFTESWYRSGLNLCISFQFKLNLFDSSLILPLFRINQRETEEVCSLPRVCPALIKSVPREYMIWVILLLHNWHFLKRSLKLDQNLANLEMTDKLSDGAIRGRPQGDGGIPKLEHTSLRGEPTQTTARGCVELSKTDHTAAWGRQGLARTEHAEPRIWERNVPKMWRAMALGIRTTILFRQKHCKALQGHCVYQEWDRHDHVLQCTESV